MVDVQVFLRRAEQLIDVRNLIRDDPYPAAIALLAVHSAIAINDAVLTALTGSPYRGQDHRQAVKYTVTKCRVLKYDAGGTKHLATLIRHKTNVTYGDRATTFEEADRLRVDAERFETWAYKLLISKGVSVRDV